MQRFRSRRREAKVNITGKELGFSRGMKNAVGIRGRGSRFCGHYPRFPNLGLLPEEGVIVFPAAVNASAITAKPTCRMRLRDIKLAGMTTSQTPRLRLEDQKVQKLLARIEKQKLLTKTPSPTLRTPQTLAS